MLTTKAIPSDFGSGGAYLAPDGAAGSPTLKEIVTDLKSANDANKGAAVALGDASVTIQVGDGRWRRLPAATLTANRSITLGTTGAVAGDEIDFTRLDVGAFTFAIVNGGGGAGTLITFPVSKLGSGTFRFNGTNWELKSFGMQP